MDLWGKLDLDMSFISTVEIRGDTCCQLEGENKDCHIC